MSLKKNLALIRAVHDAGFRLMEVSSISSTVGACWVATLAHGRTKLARISNDGIGGQDETDYLETKKLSIAAINEQISALIALPSVQELVKDYLVQQEAWSLEFEHITQEQFDENKAKILASPALATRRAVELTTRFLLNARHDIATIKHYAKDRVCFVLVGDDAKGAWSWVKCPDTPENRAVLRQRKKIDYFLNDLVAGL